MTKNEIHNYIRKNIEKKFLYTKINDTTLKNVKEVVFHLIEEIYPQQFKIEANFDKFGRRVSDIIPGKVMVQLTPLTPWAENFLLEPSRDKNI